MAAREGAYFWPDREYNAHQYLQGYNFIGAGLYHPGWNTADPGYVPFTTVAPVVGVSPVDGGATLGLITGRRRRAVRIAIEPPPD